jgi:hypothetical protein
MVEELRILLRELVGRTGQPTIMILERRTLQSMPESGARGSYDGAKRREGSKIHAAMDTQGHASCRDRPTGRQKQRRR